MLWIGIVLMTVRLMPISVCIRFRTGIQIWIRVPDLDPGSRSILSKNKKILITLVTHIILGLYKTHTERHLSIMYVTRAYFCAFLNRYFKEMLFFSHEKGRMRIRNRYPDPVSLG